MTTYTPWLDKPVPTLTGFSPEELEILAARMLGECRLCGSVAFKRADGAGPHYARINCENAHFQRWVPRPVAAE